MRYYSLSRTKVESSEAPVCNGGKANCQDFKHFLVGDAELVAGDQRRKNRCLRLTVKNRTWQKDYPCFGNFRMKQIHTAGSFQKLGSTRERQPSFETARPIDSLSS